MRLLKALVVAATTLSAIAGPIRFTRRGQDPNVLVLQFASVLENLESEFYKQGIQKFSDSDFQNAGFTSTSIVNEQLTTIQGDEATHLDFLKKALSSVGSSAPDNCQFNFDSVLTDVATMAATARVVELVGVGAYIGAATLINDPQILVAAATILTVEARHQTILNAMSGIGSPIPQAFDIALAPGEVLAIAGAFIQGCDLGIPANKPLTVTNQAPPQIGDLVQFSFDGMSNMNNLHCQMLLPGSVNSISLPIEQCIVPQGVNGPVVLFVTSDQQPLANNVVLRPTANNLIAGPVIAFIDSQPSPLSQLLRAGASSGGASDISSVITPDQAGQIISEGQSSSSSQEDGPNFNTGTEAGGVIIVDGWTNLPGQDLSGQNQNQDNSMSSYQSNSMNSYQNQDSNSMQSDGSMNSMDQNMNSYQSQNSGSMQSEDSMNMNSYQNQNSGSMQGDSMNSMDQNMNSNQSQNSDSMQSGDSMSSMQSGDSMNSMQSGDSNNSQDNSSFDLSGSSTDSSTEAPASSDGSS